MKTQMQRTLELFDEMKVEYFIETLKGDFYDVIFTSSEQGDGYYFRFTKEGEFNYQGVP